jgi:FG-GAP-like repeat
LIDECHSGAYPPVDHKENVMLFPARQLGFVVATLLTVLPVSFSSAAVMGELKTGSAGTMTITLLSITFNTDPSSNPPGPPWNVEVAGGTNLMFLGCPSGVLGAAGCLDSGAFSPAEGIEIATVNLGGTPPTNFLQFAGNGISHASIVYSLTTAGPGSGNTDCAALANIGDSCSIFAGSSILLTRSGNGTTLTFPVSGQVTDGSIATPWRGAFVGSVAGKTPLQIQLFFCPSGTCTAADFASGRSLSFSQSGDLVSPLSRVVSDFNGDGKSDVSLQNSGSGDVAVWLINGSTITSGAVVGSPGTAWKIVATGDFAGDGKADLLLQNSTTGDVVEWEMNGTVITAGAVIGSPGLAWKVIGTGDFNGDGRSDIVLQNSTTGDVAEWQMNGMAIAAGGIVGSPGPAYKLVAAGDFNGDGKSDLVLQNSTTGDVAVWLLNGMTITAGPNLGGSGTVWHLIAAGDFNGDGRSDLILQNSTTGDAAVWRLNAAGTAIASGAVLGGSGTTWKVVGTADFNADGTADVVLQNTTTGDVAEWQLDSAGTAIVSGAILGGSGTSWVALMN